MASVNAKFCSENEKGQKYLGDIDVDGRTILSRVGSMHVTYRRVLDWLIRFIDTLLTQLETTGSTALSLICTLYSSPLHTH
jgi:hypothetical protein